MSAAWAAGFWDGEGSICYRYDEGKRYRAFTASVCQNDREVLDKFKSVVVVGRVLGPYKYNRDSGGTYYQWQLHNAAGVRKLARTLWPHLGTVKKQQFIKAMRGFVHDGIRLRKAHRFGPLPMKLVA